MTESDGDPEAGARYAHDKEVMKQALSAIAGHCVHEEGCDRLSVASAARNVSLMISQCRHPQSHYDFLGGWHEIADFRAQCAGVESRKLHRLIEALNKMGTGASTQDG